MKTTMNTIQPVSHLQNYNKNIAPVLNSGKRVHLTKGGKNYWEIMTSAQAAHLEEVGMGKILGLLLEKELDAGSHKGNKKPNLSPDKFIKKLESND